MVNTNAERSAEFQSVIDRYREVRKTHLAILKVESVKM